MTSRRIFALLSAVFALAALASAGIECDDGVCRYVSETTRVIYVVSDHADEDAELVSSVLGCETISTERLQETDDDALFVFADRVSAERYAADKEHDGLTAYLEGRELFFRGASYPLTKDGLQSFKKDAQE